MSSANAPEQHTLEGLRAQNRAYRSLCASLEAIQAAHTEESRQYHEAVKTLDSERQANAIMTNEVAILSAAGRRLYDVLDRLVHDLMEERDLPPEHQFSPLGSALTALHTERALAAPGCVCAATWPNPAEERAR